VDELVNDVLCSCGCFEKPGRELYMLCLVFVLCLVIELWEEDDRVFSPEYSQSLSPGKGVGFIRQFLQAWPTFEQDQQACKRLQGRLYLD
jgi:hypothetical protein